MDELTDAEHACEELGPCTMASFFVTASYTEYPNIHLRTGYTNVQLFRHVSSQTLPRVIDQSLPCRWCNLSMIGAPYRINDPSTTPIER